jgi:broad specificity phosphatase PhoE
VPTTLVLVRHGETNWNRERRYQGRTDTPLNDAGRRQAHELADSLHTHGLSAVYTSPLLRAKETGAILAEAIGLDALEVDALREIDVGDWEGLTFDEVRARFPEHADVGWHSGWTNGETHDQLSARVTSALVEIAQRHPGERVAVVTHGGPIRAALMAATGLSHAESRAVVGPLENCCVFRFAVRDGNLERVD